MCMYKKPTEERMKWNWKVARYLAWATHGGLVHSALTIEDILDTLQQATKGTDNIKNLVNVLDYFLHMRQADMGEKGEVKFFTYQQMSTKIR